MSTAIQRYAPSVLSFLVLVVGGLQAAVAAGPLTGVTVAQLAVLVITTFTTWLVPLIGETWRGKVKTGLELTGVAITLALPFIITGTITWAEGLLVLVAFIKAGAAELGVQIRLDPVVTLPETDGSFVITNVALADARAAADAAAAERLADPQLQEVYARAGIPFPAADRVAGPDHRAESSSE